MKKTPASTNNLRFTVLAGMILGAAAFRVLPHPPNFSPIAALALFGGAQFADKRAAFLVPLTAMFLGDLALGMHATMPVVYGCFALMVCVGFWLRRRRSAGRVVAAALGASLLFFAVTNFAVWAGTGMYPKTVGGLAACYTAALPFFQNTLLGDLFFSGVLFGGLAMAERRLPELRETCPA
jgi:hypothetical protein